MIKRTIIETTKEFDTDGVLTKETIIETEEEDYNTYTPIYFSHSDMEDTFLHPLLKNS